MVTAPPVDGAGDEEEVTAPPPGIPAFVNPFENEMSDARIGGNKPFLQTAVEALCIMFWPSETREHWMVANNFNMPDPIREEFIRNSQIHCTPGDNTPPPPTMRRMSVPATVETSQHVNDVFREADALYMRTLIDQSRAMNDGFRTASAPPADASPAFTADPAHEAPTPI